MAGSSADYERQIAETRGAMESKIVELRERTRDTMRRGRRVLLIAAGVGAAIGAAAVTAFVLYRVTRPPSPRERWRRVLPEPWWDWLTHGREKVELVLRRGVPPMRLYVGDQQIGEPPPPAFERLVIRAAQAAGTAAAAALVTRAFAQFSRKRDKAA